MDSKEEKSKRHMVSLSQAAYDKVLKLNKKDRKEAGRIVTYAETIEKRIL